MNAHLLTTSIISLVIAVFFCYQIYVFNKEEKQHKKLRQYAPTNQIEQLFKQLDAMQSDYNWISNIIQSCTNSFHFQAVDKLIELFEARYNNIDSTTTTDLKQKRQNQFNDCHFILN